MDSLTINLDVNDKKGNFTQVKAIGAYERVALTIYNFPAIPDLASLVASLYLDNGILVTNCDIFTAHPTITGAYVSTMILETDQAVAYFSVMPPSFSQDLTLVVSDANQLYCNSRLLVKNNPNDIPPMPYPIVTSFVFEAPIDGGFYVRNNAAWSAMPNPSTLVIKNASGFTADLEGATPITNFDDDMNAGEVRDGLVSLVLYLRARGIL